MDYIKIGLNSPVLNINDEKIKAEFGMFIANPELSEVKTYEMGVTDYVIDKWDVQLELHLAESEFEKIEFLSKATSILVYEYDETGEEICRIEIFRVLKESSSSKIKRLHQVVFKCLATRDSTNLKNYFTLQ